MKSMDGAPALGHKPPLFGVNYPEANLLRCPHEGMAACRWSGHDGLIEPTGLREIRAVH